MGNSASALPYTVDEETHPATRPGSYGFAIHSGCRKSDSLPVTVFKGSKASLVSTPLCRQSRDPSHNQFLCANHHFRKCKTLVHPNLLKVYATLDTDYPNGDTPDLSNRPPHQPLGKDILQAGELLIVTERAVPLLDYLDGLSPTSENAAKVGYGLHNIINALGFLHNTAKLAHGAVCPSSVYVTPAGDFKLFHYSLLTPVGIQDGGGGPTIHFRHFEASVTPNEYRSPERLENRWDAISTSAVHTMDSFSLGVLIEHLYGHPGTGTSGQIPLKLQKAVQRLVTPNIRMRPRVLPLLKCPVFDVPYIHAMDFLDTMSVKPAEEKVRFIQSLPELLNRGVLGRDVAIHKVMPVLVGAVMTISQTEGAMQQDVNRREVLAVIPPLFFIAEKHLMDDPEEFRSALTPIVELLFRINDRGVRGALLQRSSLYSAHLDQAALNNSVFEPMCSGFTDSSAALRELTLKSAILLVPKLTPSNLEKLVRYLIRLQSDPEPSIRTNTAIFVGKVAPNLSEMSRQKLILPAFERAMKDDFKPCRLAALRAVQSCKDYYGPMDVSTKVMPAVVSHLLDVDSEVRTEAFSVMETFMVILRVESTKMAEEEKRRAAAAPADAPGSGMGGMGMGLSNGLAGVSAAASSSASGNTAEAPSSGYLSSFGSWAAAKVVSSTDSSTPATASSHVAELPKSKPAPAQAAAPSYSKPPAPAAAKPLVQQPRAGTKAPAFASLSLSDANIGGAGGVGGGGGGDGGGWSDNDDDFDVGSPSGGGDDDEDFFASFGAKPSSSTGLKMGGIKTASKIGGKGRLVMPAKKKSSAATPEGKPAVKKLSADDLGDGWDDF